MPGLVITGLWEITSVPADNTGSVDAAVRPVRLKPPGGGSIFRIAEFPPDAQWKSDTTQASEGFAPLGALHAADLQSGDPVRHKTSAIDYIVVLKGEIWGACGGCGASLKIVWPVQAARMQAGGMCAARAYLVVGRCSKQSL